MSGRQVLAPNQGDKESTLYPELIKDYLSRPVLNGDNNPLCFWDINKNNYMYRKLCKIATAKYLALSALSIIHVEILLSIAGKVFGPDTIIR